MKVTYEKVMQTAILVVLLASLAVVFFAVNPTADQNHRDFVKQQKLLQRQTERQHRIVCSQAESTANAFRFRQIGPQGKVETVPHFLTRMQAQAETLELSKGSGCSNAPGLPPFEHQVKHALTQIHRIFTRYQKPVEARKPTKAPAPHLEAPTPVQTPSAPLAPETGLAPAHGVAHQPPKEEIPPIVPKSQPEAVSVAPAEVVPMAVEIPKPPLLSVVPLCSVVRRLASLC